MFSAVNVARFAHSDPEEALRRACDKFIRRFAQVERLAQERGIRMQDTSIEKLDELWEEAKGNKNENR